MYFFGMDMKMIPGLVTNSKDYKVANESSDINITGVPELKIKEK